MTNSDLSAQSKREQERCPRLLVGMGSDTYDPECVLPAGHSGLCLPPCSTPGCENPAPRANFGGMCSDHVRGLLA